MKNPYGKSRIFAAFYHSKTAIDPVRLGRLKILQCLIVSKQILNISGIQPEFLLSPKREPLNNTM